MHNIQDTGKEAKRFHDEAMERRNGCKWYDKIMNEEILRRAHLPNMADILIEKNLRWLGHVHRMEDSRLPKQLFYS